MIYQGIDIVFLGVCWQQHGFILLHFLITSTEYQFHSELQRSTIPPQPLASYYSKTNQMTE